MIFGIILIWSAIVALWYTSHLEYMQKNHPDYKGEDFLGEESPLP
jgi:hypothetical protein